MASFACVYKGKTFTKIGGKVVRETTLALVVIFISGKSKYRVNSLDFVRILEAKDIQIKGTFFF